MSSAGRLIVSCLVVVAAGLAMLGCGSGSDATGADIDPQIATDLTGQLDRIQGFFEEGKCDRASGAVDTLRTAVDDVSDRTGAQFTANAQQLVDNLDTQVTEECQPVEKPTTDTSSTTTDTSSTTTDTTPTTTDTTTKTTTDTTKTTTTTGTTSTTTETTTIPGGGVTPGSGKRATAPGPDEKKPKHRRGDRSKHDEKERSR